MLAWDATPGPGAARRPPAACWRSWFQVPALSTWEARLHRDLGLGAVPYLLGHLMFWVHDRPGDLLAGNLDLGVAQLLFVLGTLMLWRVTQALGKPAPTTRPEEAQGAARCLAGVISLAFSPGLWVLVSLG
jgi:hypothetical protein